MQHVDLAMQLIMVDSEMRDEIKQSIEDGLNRTQRSVILVLMKDKFLLAKFGFSSRFFPGFIQLFLVSDRGCRSYSRHTSRSGYLVQVVATCLLQRSVSSWPVRLSVGWVVG